MVTAVDKERWPGVCLDSRRVEPGWLFAALPGTTVHGARFAPQAIAAGAAGVLTDAAGASLIDDRRVPVLVVDDPRAALAQIAADIHGHPADQLTMLGVTGTAGKTSTVALLAAGLRAGGQSVGTIGTLGTYLNGQRLPETTTTPTTPEAPDIQAQLADLVRRGASAVAMEVSSHALVQHRVDQITFAAAAFTNLGHDHLDFHGDQEHYYRAKASLFQTDRCDTAVVNLDDPWGQRLAGELADRGDDLVTVSLDQPADYRVLRWATTEAGLTAIELATPSGPIDFTISQLGAFSVRNVATAVALIDRSPFDLAGTLPGLSRVSIPGRMQPVDLGPGAPHVIVDFAHVPEEVSAALASLPAGRRLVVLGAGGDRDTTKRRPMGRAAAQGAEVVIVTDDNPRSEDPAAIRADVIAGARQAASGAVVIDGGDRRGAIRRALGMAETGDWVAILGRGDERDQQLADRRLPFNDADVVAQEWAGLSRSKAAAG